MIGLIKYNAKLLLTPSFYVGLLWLFSLPFLFSFQYRTEIELARITEQMVILVGIIWFSGLTHPERSARMEDTVHQMTVPQSRIFLIRFVCILTSITIGLICMLSVAAWQGAAFNSLKLFWGSFTGTLAIGLIALFFSQLTGELAIGYMVSFAYYYLEFSTKGAFTQRFYLFGLLSPTPNNKFNLIGVCLLFFILIWVMIHFRFQIRFLRLSLKPRK